MNARSVLVLRGLSLYNQGYSLGQVSQMLLRTFNERVPRNTIHYWKNNYSDIFTYLRIRKRNEPRLPLMPKVYLKHIFSLHRTKVSSLPEDLGSLSDYIYRAYRGIEQSNLTGEPIGTNIVDRSLELFQKREFKEGPPEARMIRIAEENNESDPLRSILINDDRSLCRNLPLYYNFGKELKTFGFLDLLQFDGEKVICLKYAQGRIDDPMTLRDLIGYGQALSQRANIGMDRIQVGAFDDERIWYVNLPIPMKMVRVQPKNK